MTLSGKQKNYLRGIAHNRNPIVTIGNKGLSDTVLLEVELGLDKHELIKIKLPGAGKAEKQALLGHITDATNSEAVQLIGRIAVIYRAGNEPLISLPSI